MTFKQMWTGISGQGDHTWCYVNNCCKIASDKFLTITFQRFTDIFMKLHLIWRHTGIFIQMTIQKLNGISMTSTSECLSL